MASHRSHDVTTSDGVTIQGTVHGQGPPLVFLQGVIGDGDLDWKELDLAENAGYLRSAGPYVPSMLDLIQQANVSEPPVGGPDALLAAVSKPVLVLLGSDTKPFFVTSAQHIAEQVPDARIHEIPGVGHAAPVTHPEPLAEVLGEFFSPAGKMA